MAHRGYPKIVKQETENVPYVFLKQGLTKKSENIDIMLLFFHILRIKVFAASSFQTKENVHIVLHTTLKTQE